MRQIEWAMWANEQAIISSSVILFGGIIGIAGFFQAWEIGIYAVIASILVFVVEYPRGKRVKGRTVERKFQKPFTRLVNCSGLLGRNYFVRFLFHLVLCAPLCFILATIMGGLSLFVTSMIYLAAAFKGEQWKPVGLEEKPAEDLTKKDLKSFRQPKKPPPRAPPQEIHDNRV
ncbi:cytochrome b-245 light chain-like [Saccostrea echinata]|uniref:cytochrome b-245 light chain-like n=1 Tax=Saccostrea echinata TaxID=191078 RepID=UPI002A826956|nr:cytochrome b-245 light chain-like [Saccostrea echinata]